MTQNIDTSRLDPIFTPYYQSGERVEVTWKPGFEDYGGYGSRTEGHKARFYVGKSTGWKPIYGHYILDTRLHSWYPICVMIQILRVSQVPWSFPLQSESPFSERLS
jgi:hypothetical protein